MKEYQSVKRKELVLPREVYYECVWIVRGMDRLERMVTDGIPEERANGVIRADRTSEGNEVWEFAREEAFVRLMAIRSALEVIPECYREGVLRSVMERGGRTPEGAHENTWKRYKQVFLHELAKQLALTA